jgi:precorrin-6B methylase 2
MDDDLDKIDISISNEIDSETEGIHDLKIDDVERIDKLDNALDFDLNITEDLVLNTILIIKIQVLMNLLKQRDFLNKYICIQVKSNILKN